MRSFRPLAFALVGGLLVGAAGSLLAEDIDLGATIDSAKANVQAKKYGHALTDLQTAIAEVTRLRAETLKSLFPDAPAGWTAAEAEAQENNGFAAMLTGTIVRRAYTKGDSRLTIELTVGSPAYGMMQQMLSNPMYAAAGMKQITVKGHRGTLELNAENKHATLNVLLNSAGAILKFEGDGIVRDDAEKTFGGAFDFEKAEKLVGE
jgi:hypothetical protein